MNNIRWLIKVASHIKWGFMLGLILVMLMTMFSLTMTGVQKFIIDDIFIAKNFEREWLILFVFFAAVILFCASHFIGEIILNIYARRLNRWLLGKYMKVIHTLPTRIYQNERIGRFTSYYTQDIRVISEMFTARGVFSRGVQTSLSFIILTVIVGYASPFILIGIMIIGFVFIPMGKYFAPRIRELAKDLQEKRTELNVQLVEGISSTREVIAFNRLKWENKTLNKLFSSIYSTSMDEVKLANNQMFFSESLRTGASFLVLAYGGFEVIRGNLSVGMFIIVYQFSFQLMTSVNGIYQTIMRFPESFASIDRFRKVMEGETLSPGQIIMDDPVKKVEFNKVCFRYAEDTPDVLEDFSLVLPMNEKIAFVGTSGGGKSTIAQLFIRFYEPNSGQILVDGKPLSDINRESWTDKVAIVFQEPYLFPDSIRDNLLLGREEMVEEKIIMACRNACIHDEVMRLPQGYDTVLGERGITLSGGQRQRLALARAILRNSEILILDEATSSLDLETERQVMSNLDRIRKGRMTIIIAHRLSTIMNAELICVMDRGQIVEKGTHEELLANHQKYFQLVRFQQENESMKATGTC
jgi:ABC-type multidrug transport system fused ATPase/permease subunit